LASRIYNLLRRFYADTSQIYKPSVHHARKSSKHSRITLPSRSGKVPPAVPIDAHLPDLFARVVKAVFADEAPQISLAPSPHHHRIERRAVRPELRDQHPLHDRGEDVVVVVLVVRVAIRRRRPAVWRKYYFERVKSEGLKVLVQFTTLKGNSA